MERRVLKWKPHYYDNCDWLYLWNNLNDNWPTFICAKILQWRAYDSWQTRQIPEDMISNALPTIASLLMVVPSTQLLCQGQTHEFTNWPQDVSTSMALLFAPNVTSSEWSALWECIFLVHDALDRFIRNFHLQWKKCIASYQYRFLLRCSTFAAV